MARRYSMEEKETMNETENLDETENMMEDEPAGPWITRGQRGGAHKEEQTSFDEEVIEVEHAEADFYDTLESFEETRESAKVHNAARGDIKKGLERMGYYDGHAHKIRAGQFQIVIAPADGPAKEINFTRAASTRVNITKRGAGEPEGRSSDDV